MSDQSKISSGESVSGEERTNDWLEDKASFDMEDRRENQHCPCGNQIIREGKVIMAHWCGKVCQECEAAMFKKYADRVAHQHDTEPDEPQFPR